MSMATAFSVALVGLEGRIVEVEADISGGLPRTVLVGLADTALYEARDRCKAAVTNSGHQWPSSLLTINLSPATLPKRGGHYDLAIVAAVLAADGVFGVGELAGTVLLGELGLDGRVRPVRGVLPATLAAVSAGFRRVIVPRGQAAEARLVEGIEVFGLGSLSQLVALFRGDPLPVAEPVDTTAEPSPPPATRSLDLADVIGQPEAKWAAEVATAGRHHMLFHGPPGVGKTMIAQRVPGLLPDLTTSEALEVSAIHSLAGFALSDGLIDPASLLRSAPFGVRAEHHRRRPADGEAGSDFLCTSRGSFPGRGARVLSCRVGGVTYAAGVRADHDQPLRVRDAVPGTLSVDHGSQPLSLRLGSNPRCAVPVRASPDPPVRQQDLNAHSGSNRHRSGLCAAQQGIPEGGGEVPVGTIGGGRRSCRRGTRQTSKPTGRYSLADQR